MEAARLLRSPLRATTHETLVGLLAVTGMRVGEAIRLDRDDLDWKNGLRNATLANLEGFGATWSGQLVEADVADADGSPKWNFQLHADHLNAADLDRWMGPRARPGWLQRLLPSLLGVSEKAAASELLRRVNAEGELTVDEFTLERIKLGQVRASGGFCSGG